MTRLIITNGDSAADLLAPGAAGRASCRGATCCMKGRSPVAGSKTARPFVPAISRGVSASIAAEIAAEFAARDAIMRDHAGFETIELWFEHDLYDQLQLIQILSFFADGGRTEGVVLVQADEFLGQESAETILRFADRARPIGADDLDIGDLLWADLAMPTPEPLVHRLDERTDALPFVGPALHPLPGGAALAAARARPQSRRRRFRS